jgi:predicted MFS family arabinose efflux permease
MLICDIARAPLLAAIPALHELGLLSFPLLLALVAGTGVFIAPYFAVQRAVVPELVGEEQLDVATATAFFQAANRMTIFLGPPLAGVLIGVIGASQVLYVDAASYVVSFALVAAFVHPPDVEAQEAERGVLTGVRFLFGDKLLRVWTPALTLVDVAWTLIFASLPVLVVTQYDANPRILGWLFGAFGGGALVGAIAALRIVPRVEPLALGSVAFVLQMSTMWALALPAPWEIPFTAMAVVGFFVSLVNSPMQALLTLRMPRAVRAQGLAAFGVFNSIGAPIGLVAAGWALARFDTRSVLVVVLAIQTVGVATFVVAALVERSSPSIRLPVRSVRSGS